MLVLLLACALGAGCSGKVVERTPPGDAGADSGAGGGSDLSSLTCDELGTRAYDALGRALATKADRGCQADADCEPVLAGTRCTNGCAPFDQRRAVESIRSTISQINGTVCSVFVQKGCQVIEPPCAPAGLLGSCVSGACESTPPADWTDFEMVQASGPCPPGQSCDTTWKLLPGGLVAYGRPGGATLSAADLTSVNGILRSVSFRRSMANGFQCDPPPTDVGVQFTRTASTSTGGTEGTSQDVTGCVLSGPKGNDAERLFAILQKY